MLPADDARTLSHLFHLNSEPWVGPEAWESLDDRVDDDDAREGPTSSAIALPPRDDTPLAALLHRRTSCREFADRPLAARHLGSLLWCGYGVARKAMVPELMMYRTVPSAGALYPLELFALTRRVDTLEDALYRYDTVSHELRPRGMRGLTSNVWGDALLSQTFARQANAIIFIVSVFDRSQRKYGPRGYRYVLLEAGHVAQNICLCAAERGLASLCLGGYRDTKLNALLELDTRRVGVVYAIAVGYSVANL